MQCFRFFCNWYLYVTVFIDGEEHSWSNKKQKSYKICMWQIIIYGVYMSSIIICGGNHGWQLFKNSQTLLLKSKQN